MAQEPSKPARLRLGHDRRILKRADFKATYDQGRRIRGRLFTLFCRARPQGPAGERLPWRLGMTATRKTGNAVERNRQRRRIREYFRVNQRRIPDGWDLVLNTTPRLNQASPEEMAEDLERLLKPLGARPEEKKLGPSAPDGSLS